jgi:DNA-binding NtrC family response regulator
MFQVNERADSKPAPHHILVVDDDAALGSALCDILNLTGHFRAVHIGDGEAAIKAWQREHYDLLIVDYAMSGMDGLQLLSALQALNGAAVPAIMISGSMIGEVALRSGAAAFLAKPFPMDQLLEAASKILGSRRCSIAERVKQPSAA